MSEKAVFTVDVKVEVYVESHAEAAKIVEDRLRGGTANAAADPMCLVIKDLEVSRSSRY